MDGFGAAGVPILRPSAQFTTGAPELNKQWMRASDDAFNSRILDGRSLRYAPDLEVHIVGDAPLDSDAYRRNLERVLQRSRTSATATTPTS